MQYDPKSSDPFDDETSTAMLDALTFSIGLAQSRQELMEFFEQPMNNRHFRRLQEHHKAELRKSWKATMDRLGKDSRDDQ